MLTRRVTQTLLDQSSRSGPAFQRTMGPNILPGFVPPPPSEFNLGGAITGAVGGFIAGGPGGALAGAALGGFSDDGSGATGGGKPGTGGKPGNPFTGGFTGGSGFVAGCPPGTFSIPGTNRCADLIPGGETSGEGMFMQAPSDSLAGPQLAVAGRYGPAFRPSQVGTINGRPIRRCVAGQVLGRDNLCYEDRALTRKERKWPKAPKPPITVADARAITKAESAKGRVKALAGKVGFTCKKR